jgi:hypothetical protein
MMRGWGKFAGGSCLLFLVAGCATPDANKPTYYQSPPPEDAAILTINHVSTGFLNFGNTHTIITLVDGHPPQYHFGFGQEDGPPLPVAPGQHALLVRSFNDPVAAYGCLHVDLEKGHGYVVHTTPPDMDMTTMWIEDQATGQVVGEKVKASTFKEPISAGVLIQALTAHPAVTCGEGSLPEPRSPL